VYDIPSLGYVANTRTEKKIVDRKTIHYKIKLQSSTEDGKGYNVKTSFKFQNGVSFIGTIKHSYNDALRPDDMMVRVMILMTISATEYVIKSQQNPFI
jgi:hypothetical protein